MFISVDVMLPALIYESIIAGVAVNKKGEQDIC
jgi:hypothetical protein